MNTIWIALLEKRALSYLIMTALVLYGLFSVVTMRKESAPEVQVPIAVITTVLPGASPEDVEELITNEIEDAVGNLENIKKITSSSQEGVSSVVVEFTADADIERSVQKARDEVAKVRGDLPEDATEPSVTDVNFADQPIVIATISTDLPTTEFKTFADQVEAEIEDVQGVSRVEVSGVRAREVIVIVKKEALLAHGITLGEVAGAIAAANTELPVGTINQNDIEYTLALNTAIDDPARIASIPFTTRTGVPLRLSDIAIVSDGVADATTLSRISVGGKPSLQSATLTIYKQKGTDVIAVTNRVRDLIAARNKPNEGVTAYVSFDNGDQIKKDLKQLTRVGLEAVALVMIVLFATLGWREALIAGLSIPLSLLVSFIALKESGNTINFISLFSLILSIGILVDSAIVVVEAIHVNLSKGMDKVTAARKALLEYSKPLTAGTLTTVAVFFPLFTLSGVTGEFIKSIPFTVIFVLMASIFVALGMTPLLAALTLKQRSVSAFEHRQEAYAERLRVWYKEKIGAFLDSKRRKKRFVIGIIVAFFVALALPVVGLVKATFFPQGNVDYLYVEIEDLQGTPLAQTDLHARAVEEVLYRIPEVESFTTTVGSGSSFNENAARGARYASVNVNLRTDRTKRSSELRKELSQAFATYRGATIRVYELSDGPPSGAPIKITFEGDNLTDLKKVALDARALLRTVPGATEVISSAESDASEYSLSIDRMKAAELGLSPAQIAQTLRAAVYGVEATTLKVGGEEIAVTVKLALNPNFVTPRDTTRTNIESIRSIPVPTQQGTVLLGSVLNVSLGSANEVVRHEDHERIMTVTSEVTPNMLPADVSSAFKKAAEEQLTIPEGVTMKIGGETEDVDQSFRDMFRALLFGVILILVVLVVEFNRFRTSFLVLLVVPLSLIGVLFGLLITRQPVSFPTMLGFIALAGVVVNHAIILVDVFGHLRREHPEMPLRDVVIEGGAIRLRPIILTKVTSIIGLIPLLFASDLWQPIAVAMIFGLSFTGVLTLILLPALYLKYVK
jgi:multidrug efflux pump